MKSINICLFKIKRKVNLIVPHYLIKNITSPLLTRQLLMTLTTKIKARNPTLNRLSFRFNMYQSGQKQKPLSPINNQKHSRLSNLKSLLLIVIGKSKIILQSIFYLLKTKNSKIHKKYLNHKNLLRSIRV
jgi:hypothetical protein